MNKTVALVMALSASAASATPSTTDSCEKVIAWTTFLDGAAIYCKDGCNVGEVVSPILRNSAKAGAIGSEIKMLSKAAGIQTYEVKIILTGSNREKRAISNYEVVTNDQCRIQSLIRKP